MVDCYLAAQQYKQALLVAKEALQARQRSPQVSAIRGWHASVQHRCVCVCMCDVCVFVYMCMCVFACVQALTLVGRALASSPEGRERAMQAFTKALSYSPSYTPALKALTRLFLSASEYAD